MGTTSGPANHAAKGRGREAEAEVAAAEAGPGTGGTGLHRAQEHQENQGKIIIKWRST